MGDWLQDKCNEIQKAQQEHIQKSFGSDFQKSNLNDLEKAKANIGEIHTWNGKKFKKVAEGKWVEVSESHSKTKREHNQEADIDEETDKNYYHGSEFGNNKKISDELKDSVREHREAAEKLSDKEHSDEEVGLGKNQDNKKSKDKEFHGKEKIVGRLVAAGNNPEKAQKMVHKHYEYVKRTYPDSSLKEVAEVIRTIY